MESDDDKPIKIDLRALVRERLGRASWLVPGFLMGKLERLVCQDRLNELLEHNFPRQGADFCEGVFADLDVKVEMTHADRLPSVGDRRVIIVSNHPLGGLDGMALISFFSRHYGGRVLFVVNDLLMAVKPLAPVFLPINKHGRQSRSSISAIDREMAGDDPIIIFPAGLVSRQKTRGGEISDLRWKKMFINKAIEFRRDIVPLYFDGTNSEHFYSFARRRKRSGLKFNLEMLLLPSEVFKAKGKTFRIVCGGTVPWTSFKGGRHAGDEAMEVKKIVYGLKLESKSEKKNE